jgi:hypothetical protein
MQIPKNPRRPSEQVGAKPTGQPRRRHWRRIAICLVAAAALTGAAEPGQNTPDMPNKPGNMSLPSFPPDAATQIELRDKQAKQQSFEAANAERKKQIAEDSAKLLKLATELKTEVDKTTKDTLSLTVIRKADEIEKLAHGVKEKMKLSIGGS